MHKVEKYRKKQYCYLTITCKFGWNAESSPLGLEFSLRKQLLKSNTEISKLD